MEITPGGDENSLRPLTIIVLLFSVDMEITPGVDENRSFSAIALACLR